MYPINQICVSTLKQKILVYIQKAEWEGLKGKSHKQIPAWGADNCVTLVR